MTRLALTIPMLAACFVVRGFVWHALADTACPSPCAAGAQCELVMSVPYDAEQAVLSATKSLEHGDGASVRAGGEPQDGYSSEPRSDEHERRQQRQPRRPVQQRQCQPGRGRGRQWPAQDRR